MPQHFARPSTALGSCASLLAPRSLLYLPRAPANADGHPTVVIALQYAARATPRYFAAGRAIG